MGKKQRRVFTPEQKAGILAELSQSTPSAVAAKHAIGLSMLHRWKADAGMEGGKKAARKSKARKGKATRAVAASNGHANGAPQPGTKDLPLEIKGLQSWLRACVREELAKILGSLGGQP
jgi:transposase-like protein